MQTAIFRDFSLVAEPEVGFPLALRFPVHHSWARLQRSLCSIHCLGVTRPRGLCVAYYESGFDTEAQNTLEDGSTAYGIFQIDSRIWCKNDEEPSKNRCHISCSDLLNDDISDDIMCAKKIVKETESMDYWDSWKIHCEDKDLSEWIEGCNDN
uniref:Glycosyl hydrolases family 22 (GH22) domain-containing protein n=1 Tax=Ornithorhynchus anatinus TaxID=9258 RepID=A0A6I8P8R1_ORNAN